MSENQEVIIKFFKVYNMWRYEIKKGKSTYLGSGNDFDDAERRAFEKAKEFKGTLHVFYEDGKLIEKPEGTFQEALIKEGFISLANEGDAKYWDKWDNDWGNP